LRNTAESVRLIGTDVNHQTVYSWIKKYVTLMARYLEKIKPNVSDAWRADELYLKNSGNSKYLFALMDDQTRFWIAQQVAASNVRPLLQKGKELAGNRSNTFITDGAPNFHDAFNKEFFTISASILSLYYHPLCNTLWRFDVIIRTPRRNRPIDSFMYAHVYVSTSAKVALRLRRAERYVKRTSNRVPREGKSGR
jgi:hypothetical protein